MEDRGVSGTHLDGDFGVLVGQLQGVVEHLQVLLQRQRGRRQLLLVRLDVLGQLGRGVDELEPLAALQARQQPLVVLGVLPHPRVAVVDVHGRHVLVGEAGEHHEPLGQEVGLEAVAGSHVGQVHHDLVGFGVVGLEGEEDVVDEQVSVYLARFEPERQPTRPNSALWGLKRVTIKKWSNDNVTVAVSHLRYRTSNPEITRRERQKGQKAASEELESFGVRTHKERLAADPSSK